MKIEDLQTGKTYRSEFSGFEGKFIGITGSLITFMPNKNSSSRNKLLSICVLLMLSFFANAQTYGKKWSEKDPVKYAFVSIAFDARHAVSGSNQTDNKPSLDFIAQIGANYHNVEVAIEYEDHSALKPKFQRYAVLVGYSFDLTQDFSLYNGVSFGCINRAGNTSFFSFGYNGELRYDLSDKFILGARLNVQERKDIEFYCSDCDSKKWVSSGFISLYYKLN